MLKTTFHISKMDCPSEERLIRMKLDGVPGIKSMDFDIPGRLLTIVHDGEKDKIVDRINELNLGASVMESIMTGHVEYSGIQDDRMEKKLLWTVLGINFFFFILEMVTGFLADSMGLVADSLDMLADSFVYGLALFAVGGASVKKKRVALLSGYFQLALAILGFAEVIRRFIVEAPLPSFRLMIVVSLLALAGNAACLYLLQNSRSKEAHMRASVIFTSNDVIANLGVIVAGVLVLLTDSRYPDLFVGIAVFGLVGRGAVRILKLAK